jgi:hypothetical protein
VGHGQLRPRAQDAGHAAPRGSRPSPNLLTSDGGFAADGTFVSLAQWDANRHAISKQLVQRLLAWRHPGFSAHVGERIDPEDKQRLCDTAAYLVRNPLEWLARMSDHIPGACRQAGSDLTVCRPERGAVRPQSDPRRRRHSSARCQTGPAAGREALETVAHA